MKVSLARMLLVALVLLLSGMTACKCGSEKQQKKEPASKSLVRDYESTVGKLAKAKQVDIARLVPSDVDLALVANHPDRFYSWLQKRPWWKDVKSSPVLQDLYLSQNLAKLSTLRHKLASLSPVEFRIPKLEELLSTPLAIALRKTKDGNSVLVVKEIDLRIQALERLAEVFNQIDDKKKIKVETFDGMDIRSVDLNAKKSLHYVVFSNLLLLSDDKKMLEDSLFLAMGKNSSASMAAVEYDAVFESLGKTDLEFLIRSEKYPMLQLLASAKVMGMGWSHKDPQKIKISGVGDAANEDAAFEQGTFEKDAKILSMLPLDTRLLMGRTGFDAGKTFGKVLAALKKKKGSLPPAIRQLDAFSKKLGKKLVLAIMDVNPQQPSFVAIVELKDPKADTTFMEKTLVHEIEFATGAKVREIESGKSAGFKAFGVESESLSPSFSIVGPWIIVSSTQKALMQVLGTMAGKAPSMLDRQGVQTINMVEGTMGFCFVDFEKVFGDLKENLKKIISSSERFDVNDLESTWIPFFKALEKTGSMGGGWSRSGASFEGQVVAL